MTRAEAAQARIVYLPPGAEYGTYRILSVPTTALAARERLYNVVALCCQAEFVRSHAALTEGRRVGCRQCPRCAQAHPLRQAAPVFPVGEAVGPVMIVASDRPLWRRIRWACCGAEEDLSMLRLHVLKNRVKNGFEPVCGDCNRQRPHSRPTALAMRATAMLPPGIISAASAWPRPGARA